MPVTETLLPKIEEREILKLISVNPEQKFTQPPPRYTEATLIKRLEINSIGRPSTYATIVSTLFDRKYAERKEGRLHPTELGILVNDVLIPNFATVFEIGFTREMESELDQVEEGHEDWRALLAKFYGPFKQRLLEMLRARDIDGAIRHCEGTPAPIASSRAYGQPSHSEGITNRSLIASSWGTSSRQPSIRTKG